MAKAADTSWPKAAKSFQGVILPGSVGIMMTHYRTLGDNQSLKRDDMTMRMSMRMRMTMRMRMKMKNNNQLGHDNVQQTISSSARRV